MQIAPSEVVKRLEAARIESPNGLVAFDADGTLWDGDVGVDLFESALKKRALRDPAREALANAATSHGLASDGDANDLAARIYAAFTEERFPDEAIFEIMAWGFAGYSTGEMREFAIGVLRTNGLAARIIAELEPIIQWTRSSGVEVVIVSASPRAIVEPGVLARDFLATHVIAMTPATEGDVISPAVLRPTPYAKGKAEALRAYAGERAVLGAFGDSGFDIEMLKLAKVPAMVRPKASLLKRAGEVEGLGQLAR
jgi:phosphoserine phosphatase